VAYEPYAGRAAHHRWQVWKASEGAPWPAPPPAVRDGLSPSLARGLAALLAPDPAARPRGVEALRGGAESAEGPVLPEDLRAALATLRAAALVGLPGHPRPGQSWAFWFSALLVGLFLLLAAWTWWQVG